MASEQGIADTLAELMAQHDEARAKWLQKFGTDDGFDAWFTRQVLHIKGRAHQAAQGDACERTANRRPAPARGDKMGPAKEEQMGGGWRRELVNAAWLAAVGTGYKAGSSPLAGAGHNPYPDDRNQLSRVTFSRSFHAAWQKGYDMAKADIARGDLDGWYTDRVVL